MPFEARCLREILRGHRGFSQVHVPRRARGGVTVESMRRRRHCVVFERGDISDRCWRRAIDKRSGGSQRQSACRCDLRVFRCRSPESPLSNSMTKSVAISGVGRPWRGVRCGRRSSALGVRQTATRRTDASRVWSKCRRSMGSQVTRATGPLCDRAVAIRATHRHRRALPRQASVRAGQCVNRV